MAAASLLAAAAVRAKPWTRLHAPGLGSLSLPSVARVDGVEFSGAPRALEDRLRQEIGFSSGERWGLRAPSRMSARLVERFPCVRSVEWRRSYLSRTVRFSVTLRDPVAAVWTSDKPSGFIDETGRLFDDPEGFVGRADLPKVVVDSLPAEGLEELGRFVSEARASGALPSRLVRLRRQEQGDGWTAALENGMEILFGSLDRTEQKLGRLREILADAGPRFGGTLTADLRYFEDGKILVRPR